MSGPHVRALRNTESPIEHKLMVAIMEMAGYRAIVEPRCYVCDIEDMHKAMLFKSQTLFVCPQAQFASYRVDIALFGLDDRDEPITTIVECDGKDFHSRWWQVHRDAQRDSLAKRWGARIERFTGSQINRNPEWCAALALLPYLGKNWSNTPARAWCEEWEPYEGDDGAWLDLKGEAA